MEIHHGEKASLYIKRLKRKTGIKVSEVAQKMGVTSEYLSASFRDQFWSPEMRERIINALELPHDFFSPEADKPALNDKKEESEELQNLRALVLEQRRKLKEMEDAARADKEMIIKLQQDKIGLLEKNGNTV